MLAQKGKFGFLLVAILAIVTSTFRSNFEGGNTDTISSRPSHATKHSYSSLQLSSTLYDIEEDAEFEGGEEAQELFAMAETFVHFDFTSFQQSLGTGAVSRHDDALYCGYSEPIYLLNENFRI